MDQRIALVGLVLATALSCSKKESQEASRPAASPAATAVAVKPVPDPLPEVVAEVNGQPIDSRFLKVIAQAQLESGKVPPGQKDAVYRAALDNLITREVLFQQAAAHGVKADDRAVRQAYDELRARHATEPEWIQFLATQGFTPETYRTEIRIKETVRAMLAQLAREADKITEKDVSDAELRSYYDGHPDEFDVPERLDASQILVMVRSKADAATRARLRRKAQGVLERARKGEDFAQLARANSDDTGSASAGGRLPPLVRGRSAMKPLDDAAFALKPGEISGIVETPFGYHIVKLHKRLPPEHLAFEAVRDQLRAFLVQRKREQALQQSVVQLRAKAKVDVKI